MATTPATIAPVTATASVATTPVRRLVAVGEPKVEPLVVRWWGMVPWLDAEVGWPLWWTAANRPANAKSWVDQPAVTQRVAGKLVVEVSLAAGVVLDAQPRTGWNVPARVVSAETRKLTEVLRVQGQVAQTAHVPLSAPRVVEHDVLDAEQGTRLVPSVSGTGVLWLARPAVGYCVVEYQSMVRTLEVGFAIGTAPWSDEVRERVLREVVFAGKAENLPPLMLRLDVSDTETRTQRSEMVQADMAVTGEQNQFGGPAGGARDDPADGAGQDVFYTETQRTVQTVRVESTQSPGDWVEVEVASQVVMAREGGGRMVLNFEVPAP